MSVLLSIAPVAVKALPRFVWQPVGLKTHDADFREYDISALTC
jgi:hypothetical protein